jgi:hypothetical protein
MMLVITGGSVAGIIPVLAIFYVTMLYQWKASVNDLAEHADPSHVHRASVMASLDDEDDDSSSSPVDTVSKITFGANA